MSKSVLIINTPDCCAECKCLKNNRCIYDEEQRLVPFHGIDKKRTDWCPLIPLEKICKMTIEAHEEEKIKTRKEKNTKICGNCFHKFDTRDIKTFISYSNWFEDEAKGGGTYKWRYEFHRVQCPHCGSFVLKDYTTERKEDNVD